MMMIGRCYAVSPLPSKATGQTLSLTQSYGRCGKGTAVGMAGIEIIPRLPADSFLFFQMVITPRMRCALRPL